MLYFRFRPSGELSVKEILYDELFFVSSRECNDPFDGHSFLSFAADQERWTGLIELSWRGIDFAGKDELRQKLAEQLTHRAPLPYSAVCELNFGEIVAGIKPQTRGLTSIALGRSIKRCIDLYEPRRPYFVSLAKTSSNALMWSHYASKHEGHCLIFKAIDGQLAQCPRRSRSNVKRTTTKGLAANVQSSVPTGFSFEDVRYEDATPAGDAFASFPAAVSRQRLEEEERLALHRELRSRVLTKHTCWSYEEESRLILYPPMSWLFGEPVELSREERLLHFRPTQLVGMVLGARMPKEQRERLTALVRSRAQQVASDLGTPCAYLPFVLFQAELPHDRRDVNIVPKHIFSIHREIAADDAAFASELQAWQEGRGLFFEGAKVSRRQFA